MRWVGYVELMEKMRNAYERLANMGGKHSDGLAEM
jgi:hypothetical protein